METMTQTPKTIRLPSEAVEEIEAILKRRNQAEVKVESGKAVVVEIHRKLKYDGQARA